MSASREKRKRKQGLEEDGAKNAGRVDIGAIVFRNFVTVLCVLLVLALIGMVLIGQGIPQQFMTAVTAEGQKISVAEFNFFYYGSVSEFYDSMGDFLVSYGYLDTSKPLDQQQSWTEGETWHDYLVNATLDNIKNTVQWSELAKAEGVTLTAEDTENINDLLKAAEESAATQDMSVGKLLSTIYGRGVTQNNIRKFLERQLLASRYETQLNDSFTFTEQEVETYYNENKKLFDKVNYRAFKAAKAVSDEKYNRMLEEAGVEEIDLSELVDSPVGEITMEEKMAYDMVEALANNPNLTEENFNELAGELADEEDKESYSDANYTLTENGAYSESELNDWLFDESRTHGEVTILDNGDDYVAVMFLERIVEDDMTVSVRQINVTPVSDTDAGLTEAENKANQILVAVGGDEQSFISSGDITRSLLGTKYKSQLYTEIRSNDVGEEEAIKEWMFNPDRKTGDTAVLKSSSGYHVEYFSSWGRPYWKVNVENKLRSDKNTAVREEKSANTPEPKSNWLGLQLISKA